MKRITFNGKLDTFHPVLRLQSTTGFQLHVRVNGNSVYDCLLFFFSPSIITLNNSNLIEILKCVSVTGLFIIES